MHVGAELELRACSGTVQPVVAGIGVAIEIVIVGGGGEETKLSEALADAFELQEAGQKNVDVGLAAAWFV